MPPPPEEEPQPEEDGELKDLVYGPNYQHLAGGVGSDAFKARFEILQPLKCPASVDTDSFSQNVLFQNKFGTK